MKRLTLNPNDRFYKYLKKHNSFRMARVEWDFKESNTTPIYSSCLIGEMLLRALLEDTIKFMIIAGVITCMLFGGLLHLEATFIFDHTINQTVNIITSIGSNYLYFIYILGILLWICAFFMFMIFVIHKSHTLYRKKYPKKEKPKPVSSGLIRTSLKSFIDRVCVPVYVTDNPDSIDKNANDSSIPNK